MKTRNENKYDESNLICIIVHALIKGFEETSATEAQLRTLWIHILLFWLSRGRQLQLVLFLHVAKAIDIVRWLSLYRRFSLFIWQVKAFNVSVRNVFIEKDKMSVKHYHASNIAVELNIITCFRVKSGTGFIYTQNTICKRCEFTCI